MSTNQLPDGNPSLLTLCALTQELNLLSTIAKDYSYAHQVESGMADEGSRLYHAILEECRNLVGPSPEAVARNEALLLQGRGFAQAVIERGQGTRSKACECGGRVRLFKESHAPGCGVADAKAYLAATQAVASPASTNPFDVEAG